MKKDDNCEVNFLDKIFCEGITFATFYSDRGMRRKEFGAHKYFFRRF
jgi:hypothetical protein